MVHRAPLIATIAIAPIVFVGPIKTTIIGFWLGVKQGSEFIISRPSLRDHAVPGGLATRGALEPRVALGRPGGARRSR